MPDRRTILAAMGLLAFVRLAQIVLENQAEARAGGGRAPAVFAVRSYRAPRSPAQQSPVQPRREAAPAPQPSPMAPQGGGLMRGLGIAVLGGFLGSMLFSGIAHAAGGLGGFGGTGFGMIELLLLAGLGYFLYRKFMRPAVASGPGSAMQYRNTESYAHYPANAPASEPPVETSGIDYRSLTMMDRSFDPERFLKSAPDIFFKVQSAWNKQDTATLSALCGRELMQTWEEELSGSVPAISRTGWRISRCVRANLRKHGRRAVKASSPVRLHANLLDYTIDEKTGGVVSGSDRDAIEFTEYWTFSRPVGQNPWKLSAVQQA